MDGPSAEAAIPSYPGVAVSGTWIFFACPAPGKQLAKDFQSAGADMVDSGLLCAPFRK
jgi:hypothetical protein